MHIETDRSGWIFRFDLSDGVIVDRLSLGDAVELFELVGENRAFLQRWLDFIDATVILVDTRACLAPPQLGEGGIAKPNSRDYFLTGPTEKVGIGSEQPITSARIKMMLGRLGGAKLLFLPLTRIARGAGQKKLLIMHHSKVTETRSSGARVGQDDSTGLWHGNGGLPRQESRIGWRSLVVIFRT